MLLFNLELNNTVLRRVSSHSATCAWLLPPLRLYDARTNLANPGTNPANRH